jgi:hypothetical protein
MSHGYEGGNAGCFVVLIVVALLAYVALRALGFDLLAP